ncbi:MAG: DUF5666 domain-containing protein [Patescibacteria group bacterium]
MKKISLFILLPALVLSFAVFTSKASATAAAAAANNASPGSVVEVSILNSGKVDISGAKVTSISSTGSSTLTVFVGWGNAGQTYTVDISSASITRRYSYPASASEISVGDFVSFVGNVDKSVSGLLIKATSLQDYSIQKYTSTNEGTVTAKGTNTLTVSLKGNNSDSVTVAIVASTTIMKNGSSATLADISVGTYIVVDGTYNNITRTINATSIRVTNNPAYLVSRNYQGTLKSITVATGYGQSSMVVTINGVDYTVYIAYGSSVYNKDFVPTSLSNFKVGDTVRFYGALRPYTVGVADATVVRDISI